MIDVKKYCGDNHVLLWDYRLLQQRIAELEGQLATAEQDFDAKNARQLRLDNAELCERAEKAEAERDRLRTVVETVSHEVTRSYRQHTAKGMKPAWVPRLQLSDCIHLMRLMGIPREAATHADKEAKL